MSFSRIETQRFKRRHTRPPPPPPPPVSPTFIVVSCCPFFLPLRIKVGRASRERGSHHPAFRSRTDAGCHHPSLEGKPYARCRRVGAGGGGADIPRRIRRFWRVDVENVADCCFSRSVRIVSSGCSCCMYALLQDSPWSSSFVQIFRRSPGENEIEYK